MGKEKLNEHEHPYCIQTRNANFLYHIPRKGKSTLVIYAKPQGGYLPAPYERDHKKRINDSEWKRLKTAIGVEHVKYATKEQVEQALEAEKQREAFLKENDVNKRVALAKEFHRQAKTTP